MVRFGEKISVTREGEEDEIHCAWALYDPDMERVVAFFLGDVLPENEKEVLCTLSGIERNGQSAELAYSVSNTKFPFMDNTIVLLDVEEGDGSIGIRIKQDTFTVKIP